MAAKKDSNKAKVKIGVLVSGGGTNLQAIIDSCENGILKDKAEVAAVISNRADAYGLERAKKHGIFARAVDRKEFSGNAAFCEEVAREFKKRGVELVCLAGFLLMITPEFINEFQGNVINIHPALLPKFGGRGMYGHHVHDAVIRSCEKTSGATVHWVDEHFDHGDIIIQRSVPVLLDDNTESLSKRVLEVEHKIYPEAIRKIIVEKLKVES